MIQVGPRRAFFCEGPPPRPSAHAHAQHHLNYSLNKFKSSVSYTLKHCFLRLITFELLVFGMPVASDLVGSGPVRIVPYKVTCDLEPVVSVFDFDRVAMVGDGLLVANRIDQYLFVPGCSSHLVHILKHLIYRVLHIFLKFKLILFFKLK